MDFKDYYQVLELDPGATQTEIKTRFRQLAQAFHPDKNPGNASTDFRFSEIKEAYEVLTNPSKREYYLQQRWYQQSRGKRKSQGVFSPDTLIKQVIELERHLSQVDQFRFDQYALSNYLQEMFADPTVAMLNKVGDKQINDQVVERGLACCRLLSFDLFNAMITRLRKIEVTAVTTQLLEAKFLQKQKANQKDKHTIWIILVVTVLLCLIIWVFGS